MSEQGQEQEPTDGLTYSDWKEALRDGDLVGQRCEDCGNTTGSPKAACPDCGSRVLSTVSLPREGEVYSETYIAVAPEGFEDGYQVGVVKVGDARVVARLGGDDDVDIGDEVEFTDVLEEADDPAPVFEPR